MIRVVPPAPLPQRNEQRDRRVGGQPPLGEPDPVGGQ
jgi:hypothetical protein